jgi:Tol biopolymer transport system component
MKPIRGGLLSGVGAIVALLALSPAISWATYPGANGRIAFAGRSPTDSDYNIFTIQPSGSGLQQLTDNAISEYEPAWSADGQRLAYVRNAPGSIGHQVFTMNASGHDQTRVTHDNGIDSSPSFSPNGRRIVYAKDNAQTADADTPRRISIFKIRADGTDERRLVTGLVSAPQYSPNGKKIVFRGTPKRRDRSGIWTIRRDGSNLRRLTAPGRRGYSDHDPDWGPDGRHIVFLRCNVDSIHGCDYDSYVYVMRSDGSHKHPISPIFNLAAPAYSPADGRIALAMVGGESCSDIYTITAWGSDPRAVTHNCDNPSQGGDAAQPTWQPIPQP